MDTLDGLFIHIQCILDKLLDIYSYPIILSSSCKQAIFGRQLLCLGHYKGPSAVASSRETGSFFDSDSKPLARANRHPTHEILGRHHLDWERMRTQDLHCQ